MKKQIFKKGDKFRVTKNMTDGDIMQKRKGKIEVVRKHYTLNHPYIWQAESGVCYAEEQMELVKKSPKKTVRKAKIESVDKFVITSSKTYESLKEVEESLNKRGFTPGTRIFRVSEVYMPVEKSTTITYKAEYEKSYPYKKKK